MELGAARPHRPTTSCPASRSSSGSLQVEGVLRRRPEARHGARRRSVRASEPVDGPQPGEIVTADGEIELSAGRETATVTVDQHRRPPGAGRLALPLLRGQPGAATSTARRAFGMHLDIPAGTAVRFEPGDEREVDLVAFGGDARGPRPQRPDRRDRRRRRARGRAGARARAPASWARGAEPWASGSRGASTPSCSGPTTGDRVRLGDTDLWAEVEARPARARRRVRLRRRQDAARRARHVNGAITVGRRRAGLRDHERRS